MMRLAGPGLAFLLALPVLACTQAVSPVPLNNDASGGLLARNGGHQMRFPSRLAHLVAGLSTGP